VPYSATAMYEIVADVERYPEFLPWCSAAEVNPHGEREVDATLEISRGPLRKRFTTRNRLVPGRSIELSLIDGPFRHLHGAWRFEPIDDGCNVALDLEFEVSGTLLRRTLGPIFGQIADRMVDAFCRRADILLGGGG
jgi:ribosome-associated toxin RatA of RatAB toxin-antitoxin module